MDFKIIAVDFDGTLCEDKWPEIGKPNIELITYLKERQKNGDKIILWTCRKGVLAAKAISMCGNLGLHFDAVNENLPEVLELMGGDSRKIFADEYIDDKNCTKFKLPFIFKELEENHSELNEYKALGLTPEQLREIDREYSALAKEVMELRKEIKNHD